MGNILFNWNVAGPRPLTCFFAIKQALGRTTPDFERREFGAVPRLRAALHAGPVMTGELLRDQLDRLATMAARQAAAAKLESRLAQEKQFNRKVEIDAQLRGIRLELKSLSV